MADSDRMLLLDIAQEGVISTNTTYRNYKKNKLSELVPY
jgi:hypothetical protein